MPPSGPSAPPLTTSPAQLAAVAGNAGSAAPIIFFMSSVAPAASGRATSAMGCRQPRLPGPRLLRGLQPITGCTRSHGTSKQTFAGWMGRPGCAPRANFDPRGGGEVVSVRNEVELPGGSHWFKAAV